MLLFKILRASLTFLGTEVGGWGGADVGKDEGPENQIKHNEDQKFK